MKRTFRTRWTPGLLVAGLALGGVAAEGIAGEGGGRTRLAPREEARIELGRRLFFDPRVSRAGMRSCADCHDPEHGYGDRATSSRDDRGLTRRHAQPILDSADNPSAHWDGAFRRIEELVTARVTLSHRGGVSNGHEFPAGAPRSGLAADTRGAGRRLEGDPAGAAPAGDSGKSVASSGTPGPTGSGPGTSSDAGSESGAEGEESSEGTERGDRPDQGYRSPSEPEGAESAPATPSEPSASAPPASGAPSAAGAAPAVPSVPSPAAPSAAPGADARADGPAGKEGTKPPAPQDDPFAPPPPAPDAESLEFLHHDLDVATLPLADRVLEAAGRYQEGFTAAFGSPDVTIARIAESVAAYCRSVRSGTSAYDRFAAGDAKALSEPARRGLELFRGKGACAGCHVMTGARPAFTDYDFHVTGVEWNGLPFGDVAAREASFAAIGDGGAEEVSGRPRHLRAFKTPTLRDVARRAPYFHDGSAPTLASAIRHYRRGTTDPLADPRLPRVAFTDAEVGDLAAFLRSLTSDTRPGLATAAWRERAARTRLRFVDADGAPLADLPVRLVPAGDRLPAAAQDPEPEATRRTDAEGEIEYAPPRWTHVRVLLPDGLASPDGALVPDTCRRARIVVAARGKVRLWLTTPAGLRPPPTIVAEHTDATIFPERRLPRTVFRPAAGVDGATSSVTLYTALLRTDAPPRVALRLPVPRWGVDRLRMTLDPGVPVRLDLTR